MINCDHPGVSFIMQVFAIWKIDGLSSRWMSQWFSLALLLFLVLPVMAGADGTAVIKGTSGTGRTLLELHTSDIGAGVKYVKFTIDGKSYEFDVRKEKETYGYVIHDHKSEVFTVVVDNTKIDFRFWLIPGTKKITEQRGTSEKWKFFAYVEATDPRQFTEATRNHPMSPRIYLACTMDYSL